jgi:hypothetical protein
VQKSILSYFTKVSSNSQEASLPTAAKEASFSTVAAGAHWNFRLVKNLKKSIFLKSTSILFDQ